MRAIAFTVKGDPVAQPRHRVGAGKAGGKPRAYLPSDHAVHAWKGQVIVAAREAWGGKVLTGPLALRLVFLMPRPKGMVWKRRPMPRAWHSVKPDADNLAKAVKDACNGVLWEDDAQVCSLDVQKFYSAGDEVPGVIITVLFLE